MFGPLMAGRSSTPPDGQGQHGLAATIGKELEALQAGPRLEALAFDVVSRQAEGRLLFAGKEYVERRAEEHGVKADDAKTSAGNPFAVLSRGAETEGERTLVSALAARGFSRAFSAEAEDGRGALVSRFVRHLDFLELCTPLSILPLLGICLSPEALGAVHREIAQRVVDDGSGERGKSPQNRAKNAARLAALAASDTESARSAMASVLATRGLDPALSAYAAALAPGTLPAGTTAPLLGLLERRRRSSTARALMLVTGLALVGWALKGLLALIGARREVDLRITPGGLELEERTRAFGRVLRQTRSAFTFAGLQSVMREVRYPRLHLYAGAIALAIGVLSGGTWIFDGIRGGDFVLASVGAGVMLAGAVLDLVLDVVVPAHQGRVVVEVTAERGRRIRVGGLALAEADAFVIALRQRMK
jgi:hypothetical protein